MHKARGQTLNGFTLVELLIVLLIIGVLLGITLLTSISGTHKKVKEQATRLQTLFSQARDKALLENVEYGFSIDSSGGYQWWVLPVESKEWEQLVDKPFQPYQMPEGFTVQLETDESENAVRAVSQAEDKPTLVFYSDRESTPFGLSIIPAGDQKQSIVLQTDGLSEVEQFRNPDTS
ncbi:type II secretion system minor pseudopilin GspH [Endozoicomonas sp. Mp262]|uniref:type II secretion system minor pseudopilin GspH n=1 Tax=Endozoicomonas sp. Mp262 TaxID=2919499 RepID=UPI0021DAFE5A